VRAYRGTGCIGDVRAVRFVPLLEGLHGVVHRQVHHGEVEHRRWPARGGDEAATRCPVMLFQSEMTSAYQLTGVHPAGRRVRPGPRYFPEHAVDPVAQASSPAPQQHNPEV